jgi:hypothetical protein
MPEVPPIPACLADRPTVAGLVVPYLSVQSGHRAILGRVHRTKRNQCIVNKLCQIDGELLTVPCVVLVPEGQLDRRWTTEPALHPQCARYSTRACPLLNGQMTTLHNPGPHPHLACDLPGCDCGGWVMSPGQIPREPDTPAEPYVEVWLSRYDQGVNPHGELLGVAWEPSYVLRIRPVERIAAPC